MNHQAEKVLLIGFGNPGRLDDGLGPALAEVFEQKNIPGLLIEADYQLTVEDAAAVAEYDVVIFVDASINGPEPFSFRQISPRKAITFSSHSIEPEHILGLAYDLFGADARGYVLAIRGYEFNDFGQRLSEKAQKNLSEAVAFLEKTVLSGQYSEFKSA